MAEQVPAVGALLTAIEARDWESVAAQLDPAVHWTTACEEHLRGIDAVLAVLQHDPPPAPPSFHEVQGGVITRWIDCPG